MSISVTTERRGGNRFMWYWQNISNGLLTVKNLFFKMVSIVLMDIIFSKSLKCVFLFHYNLINV